MVRLLLADDHRIFRQGLARLLRDVPDFEIVAEAGNYAEATAAVRAQAIDVAIVDMRMPGRDGVDLIAYIKEIRPNVRILVMTMHSDQFSVVRALRAGAEGYMVKENAAEEVISVIPQLVRGGHYVCPVVAAQLAVGLASNRSGKMGHEGLSDREYEVFRLLVAGKRGTEIASELSLSEKTVSTHKSHVLQKLQLRNGSDLVMYAMRHNLLEV